MIKWIKAHKFLTFLIFIIISISLILSSSSMIAAWAIRDFLRDHASDIELSKVELSLWNSDITIEGLSANDSHGKKLAFDRIYLDWDSSELWDKHLVVNQLRIEGFELDIDLENLTPSQIGPLVLSKFSEKASETEVASQNINPESENWMVRLGDIKITDTKLCVLDSVLDFHSVGLELNENSNIKACFQMGKFEVAENINLSRSQTLSFRGDVDFEGIAASVSDGSEIAGLNVLALKGVEFGESLLIGAVDLEQLSLLSNSKLDIADYGVQLEQLQLKQVMFDLSSGARSFKDFLLSNTNTYLRASNQKIHSAVSLEEFRLASVAKESSNLVVSGVELSDLSLLENFKSRDETIPHLINFNEIQVTNLTQSTEKLEVGDVIIDGLNAYIASENKNKSNDTEAEEEQVINLIDWVAASPSTQQKSAKKEGEQTSSDKSVSIALSRFQLGNDSQILFTENSVGKEITHKLSDIQVEIGAWSTGQTEATPITYKLVIGASGSLSGEGEFNVGQNSPAVDIKGNIKGMNLVEFSHFASRFIGYRIDQGQLNLDYQVKISDNQIDANFDSELVKFELGDLEEHEESELNEDLGLPLPMALNLLRDSDDNIELDFPVTGDLSSPDFSIASVISTVTVKAIKNAVIYHYSPLGMLSLASGVFDLATALNFEPVVFEQGGTELPTGEKEKLDRVVKVMNEKPRIKIVVCGTATLTDFSDSSLKSETKDGANASNDQEDKTLSQEELDKLLELARVRQQNVIQYISSGGKINKDRLLGCNVKLDDDKNASPKVKLSI